VARKQTPNPTVETLREIEESGDRIAEWASDHAAQILGGIAAILVLAGGVGLYVQASDNARDEAADALALASSQYRRAMGADPLGGPIPEPANPELGESTRVEYVDRFAEVGRAHSGTASGAVAWLEAGHLQTELGQLEAAAESFGRARDEAQGSAIAALASTRLAALAEARGDAATAAQLFEDAASVTSYPLRSVALGDATRCWVDAGENAKALATYQRIEAEFPDDTIAPQITALVRELRIAQD